MHGNLSHDPVDDTDPARHGRSADEPPLPRRESPPPRREQLPLPRRDEQTHLEPQLREQDGAGSGTPFAAFGPSSPGDPPEETGPPPTGSGERAATFRAATRRAAGDAEDPA